MSSQCNSGKSRAQINIERLDAAQRRGIRLNLRSPVDLSLNRYGMYDIQQLIANLVKLSFVLGMNSPDSPTVELPTELFQRITELNEFIYGNVLGRYPVDNSNMLHMARQLPMLNPPPPPSEPSPENEEQQPPGGCTGGRSRRKGTRKKPQRSKTRRRIRRR